VQAAPRDSAPLRRRLAEKLGERGRCASVNFIIERAERLGKAVAANVRRPAHDIIALRRDPGDGDLRGDAPTSAAMARRNHQCQIGVDWSLERGPSDENLTRRSFDQCPDQPARHTP